jgi:hypothetical protein
VTVVTVVGVTGHRTLPDPALWSWVRDELGAAIATLDPPIVGVTGLAEGADQRFAEVVLDVGGSLHAVLAFEGFGESLEGADAQAAFTRLLGRAAVVETIPPQATPELAYLAEGARVVDLSEVLVAVWDGKPARGIGGTAEVVAQARQKGIPVVHLDPSAREVHRV